MKASEVRRLTRSQFLYLLRVAPKQARYIAKVLSSRVAARNRTRKAALCWNRVLTKLPSQFTLTSFYAAGGTTNMRDSLVKNGILQRVPESPHTAVEYLQNSEKLKQALT